MTVRPAVTPPQLRPTTAARIAAADALVAALLDFPTVHLERVYDLAEAYRATAPASPPTPEGDET